MKSKRNQYVVLGVGFVFILFISLAIALSRGEDKEEFLARYDLDRLSVKQVVSRLENATNEPFGASIKGDGLRLMDEEGEIKLDLPKDQFYLSIAPYVSSTHPCSYHNLVTCRGELANVDIHVLIKDKAGNVLIDETYTSAQNGFIGLWLPKNIEGTLEVSYEGLVATSPIETKPESYTCLTTPLKLS